MAKPIFIVKLPKEYHLEAIPKLADIFRNDDINQDYHTYVVPDQPVDGIVFELYNGDRENIKDLEKLIKEIKNDETI